MPLRHRMSSVPRAVGIAITLLGLAATRFGDAAPARPGTAGAS